MHQNKYVFSQLVAMFVPQPMVIPRQQTANITFHMLFISYFPFKIQTKLDNSLIINFCLLSLYQDVKRK